MTRIWLFRLLSLVVVISTPLQQDLFADAFIVYSDDYTFCNHRHRYRLRQSSVHPIMTASSRKESSSPSLSTTLPATPSPFTVHTVDGVTCREVSNELPLIGTVTVLEATAEAQQELVDEILLALDDDDVVVKAKFPIRKRIFKEDPYGAVLWPAAWALSNYLITTTSMSKMNNGSIVSQTSGILELGTGTGLVAISAAMAGAKRVLATDYEPLALKLTRYAAKNLNKHPRDHGPQGVVSSRIETRLLDLCDLDTPLPIRGSANDDSGNIDLVVAADIMYEPKTGIAMAHRAIEALRQNCRVIVGDSPGRAGRPAFLQTLHELGLNGCAFQDAVGKTCSGPRHELICGEGSLSVSDTPKDLVVAILDLQPSMLNE